MDDRSLSAPCQAHKLLQAIGKSLVWGPADLGSKPGSATGVQTGLRQGRLLLWALNFAISKGRGGEGTTSLSVALSRPAGE